jgi:hypothetical protein
MKKLFLSLALLAITTHALSSESNNAVPVLSWSERFYLNHLYSTSYQDPYFLVKISNKNLDYYLNLLEKRIEISENKIHIKETAWQSTDIKIALGLTSAISASFFCFVMYPLLRQFFTGKYNRVKVPVAMLTSLATLKFSRDERKKLNEVTVDKITFIYRNLAEKNMGHDIIDSLSLADVKKINYLTRKLAAEQAQTDIFQIAGYWLLFTGIMVSEPIYRMFSYAEYLEEQLRKDKLLYDLLCEEKTKRSL